MDDQWERMQENQFGEMLVSTLVGLIDKVEGCRSRQSRSAFAVARRSPLAGGRLHCSSHGSSNSCITAFATLPCSLSSSSPIRNRSLTLSSLAGSISTAPSSALIRLGSTTLVCGITLEIAPPEITTPNQGFLGELKLAFSVVSPLADLTLAISVPNVDLPALCSPLFRPGPPSDEAQVLSTRLRDILIAFVSFSLLSTLLTTRN